MIPYDSISQPTLLLDEARCRANITRMVRKAQASGVRFRPHFKTHQSAEIGEWFRPFGVQAITVSSVSMAQYFAQHGWRDITIAFPVNWRQIDVIRELASQVRLGLLVDSVETAETLVEHLRAPADAWIELDVGQHRSGIPQEDVAAVQRVARALSRAPGLTMRGALAHAGHLYHASSPQAVREGFTRIVNQLQEVRGQLRGQGWDDFEISWGDTPTCSLVDDLSGVDEIRPGNFVFFDLEQLQLGACREEDIAAAVACPVVSKPDGSRVITYGGAIHLSKEALDSGGEVSYGAIALPQDGGWSPSLPGAHMVSLSQEHGVGWMHPSDLDRVPLGDLLVVLPVHSCLVVDLLPGYTTLDGKSIATMGKR
jgi:D-serine deaminase-like pyridoxal phosphate-dependent protein